MTNIDTEDLKELLKHPVAAGIIIALTSAIAIYLLPNNGLCIIVVVVAFLTSEGISELFVRGGGGVLQIRPLGVRADRSIGRGKGENLHSMGKYHNLI